MFSPTLLGLKRLAPEVDIDVLVGTPSTGDLVRLYGNVRSVYTMNVRKSFASVVKAGLAARSRRYDWIVFTFGIARWKARLFALLVGAQTCDPLRGERDIPSAGRRKHRVLENLELLCSLGVRDWIDPRPYLDGNWPTESENAVLLHPGGDSFRAFKRWPVGQFVQLARSLTDLGYSVTVALGPSEAELEMAFRRNCDAQVSIASGLPLSQMLECVARHRICVTSDSGLGHIAAAMGRRVVTIFGPADPEAVRPYSDNAIVVTISRGRPACMPCIKPGGRFGCPERPCLTGIGVSQVVAAVQAVAEADVVADE